MLHLVDFENQAESRDWFTMSPVEEAKSKEWLVNSIDLICMHTTELELDMLSKPGRG